MPTFKVHGHDVLRVTLWKDYNDGLSYVVNFSFRFSLLLEGLSTNSGESLETSMIKSEK